jgi:uncharacterized membrane protein YqaE (UPF0057 family)
MADLLLIIIAILLPPLAVYLHEKSCNNQVLINILLCIFTVYIGALIHALWILTR